MSSVFPYAHSDSIVNVSHAPSAFGEFASLMPASECATAMSVISAWDGYAATPLTDLIDIAASANVKRVMFKDESSRFGLGSFKALGGSYAVARLAKEYADEHGSMTGFSVATATDGNHGRSVAWGAKRLGLECHIFIHAHVSAQRADAMAALGAEVHRVDGNYDDSLVACEDMSKQHGWQIVSDTSWEGYETVPLHVMAGYSVMAAEVVEQLRGSIPTHCFIPAGCGGLAGAMVAFLWRTFGHQLPRIIIVESSMSDCVFQSVANQDVTLMRVVDETIMAGLSCGEVSRVVWPVLQKSISHVITIPDEGVAPMMRWLARPESADRPSIEGGECSAAGLIALMACARDPALAASVGLDEHASVLVFGTEGATDPELYARVMQEA